MKNTRKNEKIQLENKSRKIGQKLPCGSELRRLFIAGRYSGVIKMRKSLSNGLQEMNALRPAAFKHNALRVFGKEARFSLVAGT